MKKEETGVDAPAKTTINTTDYNADGYKDFDRHMIVSTEDDDDTTIRDASDYTTNEIAQLVEKDIDLITFRDNGQIYYNDHGVYRPFGEDIIAENVEKRFDGNGVTTRLVDAVTRSIKWRTYVDRDDFEKISIGKLPFVRYNLYVKQTFARQTYTKRTVGT